jgi:UDP:flavonoid glycosyltransferase YjiC (YdhE family)
MALFARIAAMRILLVCLGSAGDVLPFVALGCELKRRKHGVSLVTNPYFKSAIENAGLDFVRMGQSSDMERALKNPHLYHPRKGSEVFYQYVVLPSILAGYQAILRCYVPGHTVLVASRYSAAARMAQDKLHIPTVSVVLTPYGFCKVQNSARVTSDVNAFRSSLGLPRVTRVLSRWLFSPERVIGFFPDWYAAPQFDWPPQVRLTGFPLEDSTIPEELPSALSAFMDAGAPPIVFTPGTAMQHAGQFFRESAKACKKAESRAVFVTPFNQQIPSGLPAGIRHVRSAPFARLLRHASAVVHAGGIGTSAQAMAVGIPQLVVPLAYDQFDNAQRLQKLGVALSIDHDAYRSAVIKNRLLRLTTEPRIRARCTALAARFKNRSSIKDACKEIEAFAREKKVPF